MLTQKMGGIFDCRAFDQSGKLDHDKRRMLTDTDNVTFSALIPIDQVPDMFKQNGQLDSLVTPKSSKSEREAAAAEGRQPIMNVVSVKFKIGANCQWFNAKAKPCERPTNAELESNRYNVQIDFTRKAKEPSNPLKPSGYWVNAIMIEKIERNPFAGQAFDASDDEQECTDEEQPAPAPAPAAPQPNQGGTDKEEDDLPF